MTVDHSLKNFIRPEIAEVLEAVALLRAGKRTEISVLRMLEIYEIVRGSRDEYWAEMALGTANQAARI